MVEHHGGKKYGKETPFIGGLTYASLRIDSVNKSHIAVGSCSLDGSPRSPLTIPESNPFEIPFRTVGIYPENDIAFFENCDRPASSSEKRFIGKFAFCSGIAHPLNALKVAAKYGLF